MHEEASAERHRPHRKPLWGPGPTFPRFRDQDVTDDCLGRVIDASHVAASEWTLQTWRWIVVRGEEEKKYLEAATYLETPLRSAPVILICLADTLAWKSAPQHLQVMIASRRITEEESLEALRRVREYYSSSPEMAKRTALANSLVAAHQILLGAAELGLSGYWAIEFDEAKIKTRFHIPDHFLVAALLPLGHREETQTARIAKCPLRSIIYNEKFGEGFGSQ